MFCISNYKTEDQAAEVKTAIIGGKDIAITGTEDAERSELCRACMNECSISGIIYTIIPDTTCVSAEYINKRLDATPPHSIIFTTSIKKEDDLLVILFCFFNHRFQKLWLKLAKKL